MTPRRWRKPLAALFLAALGLLAATAQPPASAETDALAEDKKLIPGDAALVVYAEVAKVYDSPMAQNLRTAFAMPLSEMYESMKKEFGVEPADLERVLIAWPKMLGPGDESEFIAAVTLRKPVGKDEFVKGLRPAKPGKDATDKMDKMEKEMKKAAAAPKAPAVPKLEPTEGLKEGETLLQNNTVLIPKGERRYHIVGKRLLKAYREGKAAAEGPQSDTVAKIGSGPHLVYGMNLKNFPPELQNIDQPEVAPFKPLFQSQAVVITASADKEARGTITFRTESEAKAADAERCLQILVSLARAGLKASMKDLADAPEAAPGKPAPKADPRAAAFGPLFKKLDASLAASKIAHTGREASLSLALEIDATAVAGVSAAFTKPRMAAARAQSQNNLKQIMLALHNYADANGKFPPAALVNRKGKPLLSWRVLILPYVEQDALYKQFKLDEPWDSPNNIKLAQTRIKVFELPNRPEPADAKFGTTHYRVFLGKGAGWELLAGRGFQDITDGTSNTLAVFEAKDAVPWSKPDEIEFDPKKEMKAYMLFGEGNVCNIGMYDGSVRAVSNKIAETTLKALITAGGGEVIDFGALDE